jgi:hypothetical protein
VKNRQSISTATERTDEEPKKSQGSREMNLRKKMQEERTLSRCQFLTTFRTPMTQAFQLLQDLAEAYASVKNDPAFRRGLVRLMAKHGNSGAWVKRLMSGGFMWTLKTQTGTSREKRPKSVPADNIRRGNKEQ